MLDRNNVGCEKLLPVHVPSTQPNSPLASMQTAKGAAVQKLTQPYLQHSSLVTNLARLLANFFTCFEVLYEAVLGGT